MAEYGMLIKNPGQWTPTPLETQASATQALVVPTQTTITNMGITASNTLVAMTGATSVPADTAIINDNFTMLGQAVAQIKVDIAALNALVTALRLALINTTIIKGSA